MDLVTPKFSVLNYGIGELDQKQELHTHLALASPSLRQFLKQSFELICIEDMVS